MRNLKLIVSYNGTAYHGFQRQSGLLTVQEVIESALTKLLKTETPVIGCGRTDAGVHARGYCLNFRTDVNIPERGLVKGLNALLPSDIAALRCKEAGADFHARYSAKSKEYHYLIDNSRIRDVFALNMTYFYPRALNIRLMEQAARLFVGTYDFSAYCTAESLETVKSKKRGATREIFDFSVWRDGNKVLFIVKGDGFLHNMVRIMAGTLIAVSERKISLDGVKASLDGGTREMAGQTLPPQGLYLDKVVYEEEE